MDVRLFQQKRREDLGSKTDSMDGVDAEPGQDPGCYPVSGNIDRPVPVAVIVADIFHLNQSDYETRSYCFRP